MIIHIYNNSVYLSTKKCLHKLFKSYKTDFICNFKNRILKKETYFIIK